MRLDIYTTLFVMAIGNGVGTIMLTDTNSGLDICTMMVTGSPSGFLNFI